MKIDFKKFEVYNSLDKSNILLIDISKDLANGLYRTASGIEGHALSLKIYNSCGCEDYSDEEFDLILKYANQYGTPFFIDALQRLKEDEKSNDSESTEVDE